MANRYSAELTSIVRSECRQAISAITDVAEMPEATHVERDDRRGTVVLCNVELKGRIVTLSVGSAARAERGNIFFI
jgi:hypothetical protein